MVALLPAALRAQRRVGFVYRVSGRRRVGASTAQVLTVTGYEQLAAVVAGTIATLAGFLAAGVDPPVLAIVLFGGALVAAVARPPGARRPLAAAPPARARHRDGRARCAAARWR